MDFILPEKIVIALKGKCRRLQLFAGLLQSSMDETSRILGNELEDIASGIIDDVSSALPESDE